MAGFDATFSPPKSLSVWWALTGDPGLLDAHDVAVTAALDHLECFGATTRVRVDGRRLHPDTLGLTMAAFRQTTSRADDPQIHTHAVISAKVQTSDGRWLALDARYLKRNQRMLGGLYQSVLRAELTRRYGIAWEPIVNGQAEIAGMPRELLEVFSNAPARSTPWPPRSRSSAIDKDGTRRHGSGPRCAGKHQPTPAATRRATVARIFGHGGQLRPPNSTGRRAGSSPPSTPPECRGTSARRRSPSRRSSIDSRCAGRRGPAPRCYERSVISSRPCPRWRDTDGPPP